MAFICSYQNFINKTYGINKFNRVLKTKVNQITINKLDESAMILNEQLIRLSILEKLISKYWHALDDSTLWEIFLIKI